MKKTVINHAYMEKMLQPMPEGFEAQTLGLLADAYRKTPTASPQLGRRRRMRTVWIAVALALLLAGVAVAAIHWGTRSFVSYTDAQGNLQANEPLLAHIQPVGETYAGETLDVSVIDAVYDGRSVVMTWTTHNRTDAPLYMVSVPTFNGEGDGAGMRTDMGCGLLAPGETKEHGLSSSLVQADSMDAESCVVSLHYVVLQPTGPVQSSWADDPEQNYRRPEAELEALRVEGTLLIDGMTGEIEIPEALWAELEMLPYPDQLVQAGLMTPVETFEIVYTLEKQASIATASAGETIDYGAFSLRLLTAEKSLNTVTIRVEAIFPDERSAKKAPHQMLAYLNENGEDYFAGSNVGYWRETEEPQANPDGTWSWVYFATATDLAGQGDRCEISPMGLDGQRLTVTFE